MRSGTSTLGAQRESTGNAGTRLTPCTGAVDR